MQFDPFPYLQLGTREYLVLNIFVSQDNFYLIRILAFKVESCIFQCAFVIDQIPS